MSRRTVAWSLLPALALAAGGCFSLSSPAPPPVLRYQLDYPAPRAAAVTLPAVLQLLPLRSAAAYEHEGIAYREGEYDLAAYHYRRWAVQPARMIADLIERDFVESRQFRAVLRGPSPLRPDYVLGGALEVIEERDAGGCSAHLRLRFTLAGRTEAIDAAPIFQRSYAAEEPCSGETVEDLVAAMSRALWSISERLRADVVAAVEGPAHHPTGGQGSR